MGIRHSCQSMEVATVESTDEHLLMWLCSLMRDLQWQMQSMSDLQWQMQSMSDLQWQMQSMSDLQWQMQSMSDLQWQMHPWQVTESFKQELHLMTRNEDN